MTARDKREFIGLQSSFALTYLFENEKIITFWVAEYTNMFQILRSASLKCLTILRMTHLSGKTFPTYEIPNEQITVTIN